MPTFKPEQQWEAYLSAFNAQEAGERENLLQQSVSDDVEFTNPGSNGKSRSVLSTHIQEFHEKMPGLYFTTDKTFLSQGDLLAVWSMFRPDGSKIAMGYNYLRFDAAGRFTFMAGFF